MTEHLKNLPLSTRTQLASAMLSALESRPPQDDEPFDDEFLEILKLCDLNSDEGIQALVQATQDELDKTQFELSIINTKRAALQKEFALNREFFHEQGYDLDALLAE